MMKMKTKLLTAYCFFFVVDQLNEVFFANCRY